MPTRLGEQMLLGIQLSLNSSGVVTGARIAEDSFDRIENRAVRTRNRVDQAARDMQKAMQAAMGLGAAGTASLGAGFALQNKMITPAIEQAKTFEAEMAQLKFVTGAVGDELKKLSETAIQTGIDTQFSPQEATKGMRLLRQAGLSTKKMYEEIRPTLKLVTGAGGALTLEQGAASMATALLKFNRTGEDGTKIMNEFAQSIRETQMQWSDLPIFLGSMRDVAAITKTTSAQAITLIGLLRDTGLSAAESAQALAGFGRSLSMTQARVEDFLMRNKMSEEELFKLPNLEDIKGRTRRHIRAFKELGIHIFEASGKLKDMDKLVVELANRGAELSGESQKKFMTTMQLVFGDQAKSLISAVMYANKYDKLGSAAFMEVLNRVDSTKTALEEASGAIEKTTIGLEKFIQGSRETIQVVVGESLLPFLDKYNKAWRVFYNDTLEWINDNPKLISSIMVVSVAFATILKTLGLLLIGFAAIVGIKALLVPALAAMAAQGGFMAFVMGTLSGALVPIAITLGVIVAAIGAVWVAMTIWEKIWDEKAGGIWAILRGLFTDIKLLVLGFIEFFNGESENVKLFDQLEQRGLLPFLITMLQWKERIVAIFSGIWQGIQDVTKPVAEAMGWLVHQAGIFIIWLQKMFRVFEAHDISSEISVYKDLGRVLGWFGGVVISLLIIKMGILAVTTLAVPAALAILVLGFAWVLTKISEWSYGVGESLAQLIIDIRMWVTDTKDAFVKWFKDISSKALEAGKGLISSFLKGLKEDWSSVTTWFGGKLKSLRDMLPGSDAKIGPLSTLTASGMALATTLAYGVDRASPELEISMSSMADKAYSVFSEKAVEIPKFNTSMNIEPIIVLDTTVPISIPKSEPSVEKTSSLSSYVKTNKNVEVERIVEKRPSDQTLNKTVNLTIDKMEFNVAKASPEEAERLSRLILDKIREHIEDEQEISFS